MAVILFRTHPAWPKWSALQHFSRSGSFVVKPSCFMCLLLNSNWINMSACFVWGARSCVFSKLVCLDGKQVNLPYNQENLLGMGKRIRRTSILDHDPLRVWLHKENNLLNWIFVLISEVAEMSRFQKSAVESNPLGNPRPSIVKPDSHSHFHSCWTEVICHMRILHSHCRLPPFLNTPLAADMKYSK